MAFTLEAMFLAYGGMIAGANVCEQDGAFYVVRLEHTEVDAPVLLTTLGPYATLEEARAHLADLPPPIPPPVPPPPTLMVTESDT